MNDIAWNIVSLASGLLLGAFFFGGLWWTVRGLPTFQRPALVVICSLSVRTAVTLSGFFALSSGHWQRLLGCLAGFALARLLVRWATRLERKPAPAQAALPLENPA